MEIKQDVVKSGLKSPWGLTHGQIEDYWHCDEIKIGSEKKKQN